MRACVLELQGQDCRVEITVAGAPLPALRGKSGLWLLGILTLSANQSLERDWLAGVLWPESSPEQGRANLRRTLTDLRHGLGLAAERLTTPSPQTVRLQLAQDEADVLAFQAGALERYSGELLPGCPLEWVETERRVLAEHFLAQGEARVAQLPTSQALELLERLRATDPLRESLLRLQLTALAQQGNRAEAQQVYHRFRRLLLESRLGEPSAQTQAHWRALQTPAPAEVAAPAPTIPTPLTALLGREQEREALAQLLQTHRLVTITGLGGIGKTRLALEVAREQPVAYFLELAEWSELTRLPETLNGLLPSSPEGPLLILDNFEQLVGAETNRILRAELERRPDVRCLVTSRRALGITGEVVFPLEPLALPQHRGSPERLSEFASVQLFVERARALRPSFALTEENAATIVTLCQQAEGLPLALELLAAHLRSLTPEALLQQVQRTRLPLLARRSEGEIPRHQSLTRIIESSLGLLSDEHRAGFRRLGVFRGGWSLEAAQAVCGLPDLLSTLALLETLEDCSLIRSLEGRDTQLEALREFALTQLSDQERVAALRAHTEFFVDFAAQHANTPTGLAALDTEQANLRGALDTLLTLGETTGAVRWAQALRLYWYHRTGGRQFLESILSQLTATAERADLQENLGVLCAMSADYGAAQRYFSEALEHFRATEDVLAQAKILTNQAGMALERGELAIARQGLEEALPLWRALDQPQPPARRGGLPRGTPALYRARRSARRGQCPCRFG